MKNTDKITLTVGQLKKLVKESAFGDWKYQVICKRYTNDGSEPYIQVAKFDNFDDANELALILQRAVVSLSNHIGALANFEVADRDGNYPLEKSDDIGESMDESDECYAIVRFGGSIGSKYDHRVNGKPCVLYKDGLSKEEAKEEVKKYRKMLTPGEREYYKITYSVVPCSQIKSI